VAPRREPVMIAKHGGVYNRCRGSWDIFVQGEAILP
jgi:hypothetical protein